MYYTLNTRINTWLFNIWSTNVYKHGLKYTTLSCVKRKGNFYLLQPLKMIFFQIDPSIAMEMCWLQTTAQWDDLSPNHIRFMIHMYYFILSILDHCLYIKMMVFLDYNLKTTHILCLNETHFNTLMSNNTCWTLI